MPPAKMDKPKKNDLCTQPDVILDILYDSGLLYISVQNIGDQPAHHVRITFDQPIPGIDEQPVNDLNLFHHLEFLPPGKALHTFLNRADLYFQAEAPARFVVTVDFRDAQEKKFQNKIKHDLTIYEDKQIVTAKLTPPTSHQGDRKRKDKKTL